MGFFDSHDTSNSRQEGNNSGGSFIDFQQSGEIPIFFWIGIFSLIGGISIFSCWRYNKTRNYKLRAKYGDLKQQPRGGYGGQQGARHEVPDVGNPVDKYFLRRDRRRQEKNAIWGRMQEISSDEEGEVYTGGPAEGQQMHSYVEKVKRHRPKRQHPYGLDPKQRQQAQEQIRSLKQRGIIARPGKWEDFLPANVNMHEVIDRLSKVAERQRQEREEGAVSRIPQHQTSSASSESEHQSTTGNEMWVYKPQQINYTLQRDGSYA